MLICIAPVCQFTSEALRDDDGQTEDVWAGKTNRRWQWRNWQIEKVKDGEEDSEDEWMEKMTAGFSLDLNFQDVMTST